MQCTAFGESYATNIARGSFLCRRVNKRGRGGGQGREARVGWGDEGMLKTLAGVFMFSWTIWPHTSIYMAFIPFEDGACVHETCLVLRKTERNFQILTPLISSTHTTHPNPELHVGSWDTRVRISDERLISCPKLPIRYMCRFTSRESRRCLLLP